MKRLVSISLGIFTCICLIVASERRAFGYVDPGSGLLAIQSIASVMAAFGYFMRRRIMRLFGRKKLPIATKESKTASAG
jgi:hypothetical protein